METPCHPNVAAGALRVDHDGCLRYAQRHNLKQWQPLEVGLMYNLDPSSGHAIIVYPETSGILRRPTGNLYAICFTREQVRRWPWRPRGNRIELKRGTIYRFNALRTLEQHTLPQPTRDPADS